MHPPEEQPTYKKPVHLKAAKYFVVANVFSLKKRRKKKDPSKHWDYESSAHKLPPLPLPHLPQQYWKILLNKFFNKIDLKTFVSTAGEL